MPLSEPVRGEIQILVAKLLQHRVTFLIGAGMSAAPPTDLPSATQLAQRLHARLAGELPGGALDGVDPSDLLGVADAVEAADAHGVELLQTILAEIPFDSAVPNFGHRAVALLFGEDLIHTVLSTNFDTCVERAADPPGSIHACRDATEMQLGGGKGRIAKLHGCATKQDSMRLTSNQLRSPQDWAVSVVSSAAAQDAFVIIGIGSVAPYVRLTLEGVKQYARQAESVWIVSPLISSDWGTILGDGNQAHQLSASAETFLDELLRGCARRQFQDVMSRAGELDTGGMADGAVSRAAQQLINELEQYDTERLALYLRKGVIPRSPPATVAFGPDGLRALIALALIQSSLGAAPEIERRGQFVSLRINDFLVEFVFAHDAESTAALSDAIRKRLETERSHGLIDKDVASVLLVSHGHLGQLPTNPPPDDVVGSSSPDDILGGPRTAADRWVSLDRITAAAADVSQLRAILNGVMGWK